MSYNKINLFHIFLLGPLITYIGFKGIKTEKMAYGALVAYALAIPFIVRTPDLKLDSHNIIKWLHMIIWFSLFLYVSYKQDELNPIIFHILKFLGISACIIHSYLLYKKSNL